MIIGIPKFQPRPGQRIRAAYILEASTHSVIALLSEPTLQRMARKRGTRRTTCSTDSYPVRSRCQPKTSGRGASTYQWTS